GAKIESLESRRLLSAVADGTYSVHESYSVFVHDPYDTSDFTRTGEASGTIQVSNGSFSLVNKIGTSVGSLDATIDFDGVYNVHSESVLHGIGATPDGFSAVVKLGFFAVLVPLGRNFGFSLFTSDETYT